jgi:NAD(P) transhydrogenase
MIKYDTIIIGTGPAGEGAAMNLAKHGQKVAMVERYKIGGSCTHFGTIPSKVLRHQAQKYKEFQADFFLEKIKKLEISDYFQMAENVVEKQNKLRQNFFVKNNVDIYFGNAKFNGEHEIEIQEEGVKITADYIIIATGTFPYRPCDIDFDNPKIVDSNSIFHFKGSFSNCTIYGGGVVGCEYASILSAMGIKVNLVHQREKLLSFLDEEIIHALNYHLQNNGVNILGNEDFDFLEEKNEKIILHTKSAKKIKGDILFWANGRTGNTEKLGLEKCGLQVDTRKMLSVNKYYQTSQKHIYAAGDVIGIPSLASVSYDQGRIAANHILKQKITHHFQLMPIGIYTMPEVSSIGKTQEQLTKEKIPYEVGRAYFRSIARAQILGQAHGMLKIIFHIDSLEILGIHCFGENASEIIHIGQAIMSQQPPHNSIMYFVNTTFNYPTMAEAYRIAAFNGLNRL